MRQLICTLNEGHSQSQSQQVSLDIHWESRTVRYGVQKTNFHPTAQGILIMALELKRRREAALKAVMERDATKS
jgi:hypothetical protein